MCMHACMYVCMYVCMACMHACMYACNYTYARMHACMHACFYHAFFFSMQFFTQGLRRHRPPATLDALLARHDSCRVHAVDAETHHGLWPMVGWNRDPPTNRQRRRAAQHHPTYRATQHHPTCTDASRRRGGYASCSTLCRTPRTKVSCRHLQLHHAACVRVCVHACVRACVRWMMAGACQGVCLCIPTVIRFGIGDDNRHGGWFIVHERRPHMNATWHA